MTAVAGRTVAGTLAALVAAVCGLFGSGEAYAGSFTVSACGTNAGHQNHLLTASSSDARMSAYTACPNDGSGHAKGMTAMAEMTVGTVPVFGNAAQTFVAPTGTTIRRLHVRADGRTANGDWASLLQASNDRFASNSWNLSGCTGNAGSTAACVAALGTVEQYYDIPGATGVRSAVMCGNFSGCPTTSTGVWPYSRAYYFMHEFDVTLDDVSNPSIAATGGGLTSGQWLRGHQAIDFNASDNSGIRRTRFWADDLGTLRDDDRGCNYTYSVPCSNLTGGTYWLDTEDLSDGVHHIAADAFDATNSNWSNSYHAIYVDNHAPSEPGAPSVVGGEGWHTTNGFTIQWSNPGSAAPINRAHYELCNADGSGCSTGSQTGNDISQLSSVQVPQPGDYTMRVWLSDAAGNVSEAKSPKLHLRFDNVVPAEAQPQHRNGWVNKDDAKELDQVIDRPLVGSPPVSGIAGYAVTTDGSTPGNAVDTPASDAPFYVGHKRLTDLPEGTTPVRARTISGAGIPSDAVGSTDIHVDLTPPSLGLEGAPSPDEWSRRSVALRVTGLDPGQLSGMAGGPPDQPATFGGYISFSVDGDERHETRGPRGDLGPDGRLSHSPAAAADIPVASDGVHSVTYQAFDVAGNWSAEKSVRFKIDQTAPELVVFEEQQRSDPRLITVAASDRTSGLADGGKIELRRVSPTVGDWISVRTGREGDHYYGHIDNATLPEGDYALRVRIPDTAGNEAIGTTRRNGTDEILHISPIQVGPYLTIAGERPPQASGPDAQDSGATTDTEITATARMSTAKKTCKRKAKRHGRKKCQPARATEQLVHDTRVGFGQSTAIIGKLTTKAGVPVADAEITVLTRSATAGAAYQAEASVRTNREGAFSYTAPAGSSRTLDFHYRGNALYRHADDQVILRVPASATISASKHSARNGERVTFTGTLRGRPLPPKGKVLDLQVHYRNKWRTFATPRVPLSGKWKYRYKFQATRGTVDYRFRVRVRASSDYPYDAGYSKETRVRVAG